MLEHAKAELPNECCGLLAGVRDGDVLRVEACYKLKNEAESPTEFFAANGLGEINAKMRACRHEIVAIYHSHPTSEPIPSNKDLERNYYGDCVVHFIIGLNGAEPEMRGWWLLEKSSEPAKWKIDESESGTA